ncbi:MAG: signal peptide peptidase SppA [Bacteroidetes bacterium HGW-Bacteroidetes-17]|nr:MAG: signal peptide peptidase SppA [Bacteroidetes bacterium HGW-Bacteroidetes-17]
MKQFFKFMFASMLGFFIASIILFFLTLGLISSLLAFAEKEVVTVKDNTLLQIKLNQTIFERTSNNPFSTASLFSFAPTNSLGLNDILKAIDKAKNDDKIKGIYLELSYIPAGISTIEEIRSALERFKESGKFIVCYGEIFSQTAYYMATVADEIYFNPEGMMLFKGLNAEVMFYKGLFDKLSVEAQIVRHGKFKSAIEPYTEQKMSPENKEQTKKYLDDVWNLVLSSISISRNISVEELNAIADELKIRQPEDALKYKFVDKLLYKDEVLAQLREKLNLTEDQKIESLSLYSYNNSPTIGRTLSRNKIAVVYASGTIINMEGDDQVVGAQRVSRAIRQARTDKSVKAIVFRINSGGGDVLASEILRREIELAAVTKPLIASYGDLSASGGYWATCNATRIMANRSCLTGSIGVFGIIPNIKGLLNDKLGITIDNVGTNKNSEFISTTRQFTPFEREVMTSMIENTYETFIAHVADGRNLRKEFVDSIGQGRIWSGEDAIELGLIDQFGGLTEAIELAKELADLPDFRIQELPIQEDFLVTMMKQITGDVQVSAIERELGSDYGFIKHLRALKNSKGLQAILPYEIKVE